MRKIFLLTAALFAAFTAFAQINPNAPLEKDPAVLHGKLDNGLTYYIRHNEKPAERCDFWLLTDVGAIQETPAQNGLAHFLEHMCLNGTKNLPGKMMIDYFQSVGVQFGPNINASTGVEQTMYMLSSIPTTRQGIVDTALLTMHDYSHFVTNDPVEIDKERGVIIEEWRTRNDGQWRTQEKVFKHLFKDSKYATCNIIGTKEGLETFPPEELVSFYQTWYRPDNQALVVVGDIDPQAVLAQITELFKDVPAPENPKAKDVITIPGNDTPIVGILTDPETRATNVQMVVKSDPMPKAYRAFGVGLMTDLVQEVINQMFAERFTDIASRPDAPFLAAAASFGRINNVMDGFNVMAACKDGESLSAFAAALAEVEKARRFGFTSAEYERAKANIITGYERSAANAGDRKNGEWVNDYATDFFMGDPYMDPQYACEQVKGYLAAIPVEQINQILQTISYDKDVVILYNAPEKEGLAHPTEQQLAEVVAAVKDAQIEANQEEEIAQEFVDPATLKGSKVKKEKKGLYGSTEWTLKNGIKVVVRPSDLKKEEILFALTVPGGASLIDDSNIASLDDNMLIFYDSMGGLSQFTAPQIQKMLTGKVASEGISVGEVNNGISGSCAPKDLETLLQMVYLQIADPRFVEEEMAQAFAQMNAVVPNLEMMPNYQLATHLYKAAYGNSPRKELISVEKLPKISFAGFEEAYRKMFSNMYGATVILAGNVDLAELKPMVEKYIGSLPTSKKGASKMNPANYAYPVSGKVEDIFEFGMTTPKTSCALMYTGASKAGLKERLLMSAMTDILDIIYVDTIREEEGGTYGVGTNGQVTSLPKPMAELQIQFDTDPERAEKLIDMAIAGFESLAKNGPTEDQVTKAKGNLMRRASEQRIENGWWRNCLLTWYNSGVDVESDREAVIESITAKDIQKFAADLLAQGNFVKVVMNPAK